MAAANSPQDFGQPYVLEDYLPIAPPTPHASLCAVCHADPAHHRCSACKNIHYCSTNCQSNDWPLHKTICKPFTKSQATRPTPQHRRALYFPAAQSKPAFIYLEYGSDGKPFDISRCFPKVPEQDIRMIAFQSQYLPYWVQLSYDSNPASKRAFGKNQSLKHAFRGPVVAIAYDLDEGLGKPALDANTTMLGPVLEYAKLRGEYEGPIFVEQPQRRYTEEEWKKFMGGSRGK